MFAKKILLKFITMFLTDFFDYPKIGFYIIQRNERFLHFGILINEFYDIRAGNTAPPPPPPLFCVEKKREKRKKSNDFQSRNY